MVGQVKALARTWKARPLDLAEVGGSAAEECGTKGARPKKKERGTEVPRPKRKNAGPRSQGPKRKNAGPRSRVPFGGGRKGASALATPVRMSATV